MKKRHFIKESFSPYTGFSKDIGKIVQKLDENFRSFELHVIKTNLGIEKYNKLKKKFTFKWYRLK